MQSTFAYIIRCTHCRCAIQTQKSVGERISVEVLESDNYAENCRGQGSLFSIDGPSSHGKVPSYDTHFTFSGLFAGKCCHCAFRMGLHIDSFRSVGCYHCKRRQLVVVAAEFSKLKGNSPTTNGIHLWYGLTPELVDLILMHVVGPALVQP